MIWYVLTFLLLWLLLGAIGCWRDWQGNKRQWWISFKEPVDEETKRFCFKSYLVIIWGGPLSLYIMENHRHPQKDWTPRWYFKTPIE